MSASDSWWREFRRRMPVTENWAYFDHAAVAPLSGPARDAMIECALQTAAGGEAEWGRWREIVEDARGLAARILGAEEAEIAFVGNTTDGINLVAEGFPFDPGDNVVVPAGEFPSNLYPWMNQSRRGVEIRLVPAEGDHLHLDRLEEACDGRTRIVAVSWVGYSTGWRSDPASLAEIAHRCGALLFLDAIQGLGVFPLDVGAACVDFLAADGHKWLLAPEGAGVFYCRREHLERLRPLGVGWNSVRHAGDFSNRELTLKDSAGRYEGGSYNMAGIAGLHASLEMLLGCGVEAVCERLLETTDLLCERLQAAGAEIASSRRTGHRSGIVACELPGRDAAELKRRCRDAGVIVNCRSGRLRLSPHCYTNEEDLDRLMAALFNV